MANGNGNGENGKRIGRLDVILGSIMGICIVSAVGLVGLAAKYHAEGGVWQLLSDTRAQLFSFAEKIMIGYFALAIPKLGASSTVTTSTPDSTVTKTATPVGTVTVEAHPGGTT